MKKLTVQGAVGVDTAPDHLCHEDQMKMSIYRSIEVREDSKCLPVQFTVNWPHWVGSLNV
jgi:hypothetical protein